MSFVPLISTRYSFAAIFLAGVPFLTLYYKYKIQVLMRLQSGFVQLREEQFSQHGSRLLSITFKRRTNLFNTWRKGGRFNDITRYDNKKGCSDNSKPTNPAASLPGTAPLCLWYFFNGFVWTLTFAKVVCCSFARMALSLCAVGRILPVF